MLAVTLDRVILAAAGMVLAALCFCVSYATLHHSRETVTTHCQSINYLPSISAAVGTTSPEQQVWGLLLIVSCCMRFLGTCGYYAEFSSKLPRRHACSVRLHAALNSIELLSLMGLSVVSSSHNYPIHRNCFIVFLLSSFLYMLLHVRLCAAARAAKPKVQLIGQWSYTAKLSLLAAYTLITVVASLLYCRHMAKCEDFVYSYFAASEYLLVLLNIAFHCTLCCDIGSMRVAHVLQRNFSCEAAVWRQEAAGGDQLA